MSEKITIFDSTLRDGAQAEGISFSVEDKLRILHILDKVGIDIIEAGNPGSNPKDIEFFEILKNEELDHAKICAFGSTRRPNNKPEEDDNLQKILNSGVDTAAIFGKSSRFHTEKIINTTCEENLKMIEDSVRYLVENGIDVIFDAEHFYDGYKEDRDYAVQTVLAAERGGASCIVLCDTNGGCLPDEIDEITRDVAEQVDVEIGVHTHNDSGLGVADAIAAVNAGARHVQGTFLGFGERCGNANLSTIIPNLQLKMGYDCLDDENLKRLVNACIQVAEISNFNISGREPYIGKSAFAHKGGMHIDGIKKDSRSFEHVSPESVGNKRRLLVSEVAGRGTIIDKIKEVDPTLTKKSQETTDVMDRIKDLEYSGYQFEGADGSFKLLIRKELGAYKPFFKIEDYKVIGTQASDDSVLSASAIIKVTVDGQSVIEAAEGEGPVNALDKALRKALITFYPQIEKIRLTDFKVRVISKDATASKVRVLMENTDGETIWTTIGVSQDVIQASLIALIDAIEFKLLNDMEQQLRDYKLL